MAMNLAEIRKQQAMDRVLIGKPVYQRYLANELQADSGMLMSEIIETAIDKLISLPPIAFMNVVLDHGHDMTIEQIAMCAYGDIAHKELLPDLRMRAK